MQNNYIAMTFSSSLECKNYRFQDLFNNINNENIYYNMTRESTPLMFPTKMKEKGSKIR